LCSEKDIPKHVFGKGFLKHVFGKLVPKWPFWNMLFFLKKLLG